MGTVKIPSIPLPGVDLPVVLTRGRPGTRRIETADAAARAVQVAFPPVGRCPWSEHDHKVITDLSPSLGRRGVAGNDPAALRHAAVLAAAQHLARTCRCHHERVQMFSFDLSGDFDIGPVELNGFGMRALTAALTSPNYGYGCSVLGPALTAAAASMSGSDGEVTLTVLSDFQLFDMDSIAALGTFPAASIHAVVLNAPVPRELTALPNVMVTAVDAHGDPGDVALAVYDQLRSGRRPRRGAQRAGGQR